MAIPLRQQASDEPDRNRPVALRWNATWDSGAASAVEARTAVSSFLARVRATGRIAVPAHLPQDAQLVVSELITNALRHAPGPCGLGLDVTPGGGILSISVWDTSAERPEVRPHDGRRVGGHGLEIVRAVSHTLTVADHGAGKQITAQLRLPQATAEPAPSNPGPRQPRTTP